MKTYRNKVTGELVKAVKFNPKHSWPMCVIPAGNHPGVKYGYVPTKFGHKRLLPGNWIIQSRAGNLDAVSALTFDEIFYVAIDGAVNKR